jgi:hypothetical protein
VDTHDSEKHPRTRGLEHLATEELLDRLRNANHPDQPNKQTLEEFINEQKNEETGSDTGGDDSEEDRRK